MRTETSEIRKVTCQITGEQVPIDEAVPADLIRKPLVNQLCKKVDEWDPDGYVSMKELNNARLAHIEEQLGRSTDDKVRVLNEQVAKSVSENELIAANTEAEFEKGMTFGDRAADKIASFGGSWTFIGIFGAVLLLWMAVNSVAFIIRPFDPYPFIFLNLMLSCLAAIQAPVIMMSQNRQEERERLRGENDYKTNLKAEVEIRALNEKMDLLINDQWKHLLEIQEIQMEMIKEIGESRLKP